ncbi:MAG: hypothetical protein ACI9R3_002702 [Verrucomicrobiales bacterium]|jgi:hypothetical protein
MVTAPPSDPAALSDLLQFRCNHCFQALQVPTAFAGQSAPCPFCSQIATAPAAAQTAPPKPVPPPSLLHFPCPSCYQGLSIPAQLAGISGPCLFCGVTITAPNPASQARLSPPPEHRTTQRHHSESESRNRHAPSQPPLEQRPSTTESNSPDRVQRQVRKRVSAPTAHPNSSKKLLNTLGIVGLTFGIAAATVFFAGPGKDLFTPSSDTESKEAAFKRVLATRNRMDENKNQAIVEAASCLRSFLAASDWDEASTYAVGMPQAALGSKPPPFHSPPPENLTFHAAERKPNSESFIVKHLLERGDRKTPAVVWVEETSSGAKVRWDLLEQQISGRMRQFQGSMDASPARFYARVHQVAEKENPFADIPELSRCMSVTISSAFSSAESESFYAFAPADSTSHQQLSSLFSTTSTIEGWISASRVNLKSNVNLIIINAFQQDHPTFDRPKPRQNRLISARYGNSGILQ